MNKYKDILPQLRECPDCGNDDVKWCGISHRPYCECGKWGRTNFGSDQDAIDSWNEKTDHELLLDAKEQLKAVCAELEELQDRQDKVKADAVREAMQNNSIFLDQEAWGKLEDYASKVEAGQAKEPQRKQ